MVSAAMMRPDGIGNTVRWDMHRRCRDEMRSEHQGRGPRGCRRSDDCIREDVHDRLTDDRLDASDIEVIVENGEVTLSDTVASRFDKRQRKTSLSESLAALR